MKCFAEHCHSVMSLRTVCYKNHSSEWLLWRLDTPTVSFSRMLEQTSWHLTVINFSTLLSSLLCLSFYTSSQSHSPSPLSLGHPHSYPCTHCRKAAMYISSLHRAYCSWNTALLGSHHWDTPTQHAGDGTQWYGRSCTNSTRCCEYMCVTVCRSVVHIALIAL